MAALLCPRYLFYHCSPYLRCQERLPPNVDRTVNVELAGQPQVDQLEDLALLVEVQQEVSPAEAQGRALEQVALQLVV